MKELRKAQSEGKLPEAARLYMGETKPVEELYDVDNDPHELKNLATSPEHKKVLDRMRAAQEKWAIETRDVGLIPEPDLEERGRQAGSRYQVIRSEKAMRDLRALVDAVNRNENPELIRGALNHPDPAFRYWALVGVGKTDKEHVQKAASDGSPVVRIAALRAAAVSFGDDSAIPKLAAEMANGNVYQRLHAAQALDALGKRAAPARAALEAASKDPNEYIKRIAEHALAMLL
jgi:hypothetical protein